MKAHFFEMIMHEPMLAAEIAKTVGAVCEDIELLARDKDDILSIGRLPSIIVKHYNACMPQGKTISKEDIFENKVTHIPSFKKRFVELHLVN